MMQYSMTVLSYIYDVISYCIAYILSQYDICRSLMYSMVRKGVGSIPWVARVRALARVDIATAFDL